MTYRDVIAEPLDRAVTAEACDEESTLATAASGPPVVLVHGAWYGGWCWGEVADRLRAAGRRVYTPTLTGLAERAHLLTGEVCVSTHVADIASLLVEEDLSEVVLVGHSYGGIVISGVADALTDRIGAICFLDAFLPEDGDALITTSAYPEAMKAALARGDISVPPPPAAAFGMTDPEAAARVDARLTPHPFGAYKERVSCKGGRERIAKKSYVRAQGHRSKAFDLALERARAAPGWITLELACGHNVMLIEPERLATLILEL